MAHLRLRNIQKTYDNQQAVIHGVDLDIADGEFVVFVGPSGCGKSTLLRMIAGLEEISGGELFIGEQLANDIAPAKRGVAMVFQSYALYPHMSVYDNMAFSLKLAGTPKADVERMVKRAAEILQITHLLDRKPKALSGGQRQRVAIGRAIVRKPQVFLFDEPLSNLDAALRVQMRIELSRLHQELGTTMIYVTHDQVEAMTLGDRIVVFNGGHIEQVGTPLELYDHPANLFVAGFLGSPKMNFIPVTLQGQQDGVLKLALPDGQTVQLSGRHTDGLSSGSALTLGIRPEHLSPSEAGILQVRIDLVEHLGDSMVAYVELPGVNDILAVKLPGDRSNLKAGDLMRLHVAETHLHLFDAAGKALPRL
ncbi:ABC transporter ATP-binding protein [Leeia aquatica]|uniref:sn-glycerol-3-phosphate ABC transporter ATP-binding protein UgpC n=1 Tax=Leeia aquatica TaxID=2725557 RepID=A0A847S4L9_9NEIS|nr:sn-glycerol-3-phosphate ABC transporter ATP-binding protein UgpC [Leeia aquatica]NLR74734.1 sn-glycerol-3-phosphate ABC transporter ATP-binding protein UgpC [Leeia aquatica]